MHNADCICNMEASRIIDCGMQMSFLQRAVSIPVSTKVSGLLAKVNCVNIVQPHHLDLIRVFCFGTPFPSRFGKLILCDSSSGALFYKATGISCVWWGICFAKQCVLSNLRIGRVVKSDKMAKAMRQRATTGKSRNRQQVLLVAVDCTASWIVGRSISAFNPLGVCHAVKSTA